MVRGRGSVGPRVAVVPRPWQVLLTLPQLEEEAVVVGVGLLLLLVVVAVGCPPGPPCRWLLLRGLTGLLRGAGGS